MKIHFGAIWFGIIVGVVIMLGVFAALDMAGIDVWNPGKVPSPVGTWQSFDKVNGYEVLGVGKTGSMEPVLNGTSKIMVDYGPVGIGDLIIYEPGDGSGSVLHRIIGERNGKWIVKGDANVNPDRELVPKGSVSYRVIGILY